MKIPFGRDYSSASYRVKIFSYKNNINFPIFEK